MHDRYCLQPSIKALIQLLMLAAEREAISMAPRRAAVLSCVHAAAGWYCT